METVKTPTEQYRLLQLYPGSPYKINVGDVVDTTPHCEGKQCKSKYYTNHVGRRSWQAIEFEKYPHIWEKVESNKQAQSSDCDHQTEGSDRCKKCGTHITEIITESPFPHDGA